MKEFIDSVLERSLTLEERLKLSIDQGSERNNDLAELRLGAWRKARGVSEDEFIRELKLAYGNFENVKAKLGANFVSAVHGFDWYQQRYDLIAKLLKAPFKKDDTPQIPSVPLPYAHILSELVEEAEQRLVCKLGGSDCLFKTEGLYRALQNNLFKELHDLTSLTIYEHVTLGSLESAGEKDRKTTVEYQDYMKRKGWAHLFEDKPVAIRLIDVALSQWVNQSQNIIRRLKKDEDAIRAFVGVSESESLLVQSIEFALSDPHSGGQSVARLEFQAGRKLIYKPRSVRGDKAWSRLLTWMLARDFQTKLKVPAVIDCGDYGWVENISTHECQSDAQIECYFQAAGCWTALLHAMNSKDFHEENVIAAGNQFVPIDFEATISAGDGRPLHTSPEMESVNEADNWVENTVITTGVLPTNRPSLGGEFCLVGALTPSELVSHHHTTWKLCDDGSFKPEVVSGQSQKQTGLPQKDGQQARLYDYRKSYLNGLEYTLRFIQKHKALLLKDDLLISWFSKVQVRRIPRPTAFYSLLLCRLHDPRSWTDGASWSSQVRFLDRLPPATSSDWLNAFIRQSEISALLESDVPWFGHCVEAKCLSDGAQSVSLHDDLISGIKIVTERLTGLTKAEIQEQVDVAELSILTAHLESGSDLGQLDARPKAALDDQIRHCDVSHFFVEEVHRIRSLILGNAIIRPNSASWIGITSHDGHQGGMVGPIGHGLYGGQSGVAVFLAAYYKMFGCIETGDLALKAIAPLRYLLSSSEANHLVRVTGAHGLTGLAGIVYALSLVGEFLGEKCLFQEAVALSKRFLGLPLSHFKSELMSGAAGSVLALCRLYSVSRSEEVLNLIRWLGERYLWSPSLISSIASQPLGQERTLSGMSHGLSGISLAVASANSIIDEPELQNAAEAILRLESERYSSVDKNWPDLRIASIENLREPPCQWCHGAIGIGLSRVSTARLLGSSPIAIRDIERAVDATYSRQMRPVDHLCCGNIGITEFLGDAARQMGRSDIESAARERLCNLISAARRNGSFRWPVGGDSVNVGLFIGLSGIGYSLMRDLSAGEFPSVATLQ